MRAFTESCECWKEGFKERLHLHCLALNVHGLSLSLADHNLPFCHLAAQNAYRLGQMTSEVIADAHLIEQRYGLGEDIGLFSNKTYAKLSELDPKYKKL